MRDTPRFTDSEVAYLSSQRLGRLATQRPGGMLQNSPVGFRFDPATGTIDISGHRFEVSRKFRNVAHNGRVAFVVDDLLSVSPWHPRCVEVRGRAEALPPGGDRPALIRIHPERVIGFGLEAADDPSDSRVTDAPDWGPASMAEVRRAPRTPESRRYVERVAEVTGLTSRLNVLPFEDGAGRASLLAEIFGGELPASVTIYPPFYTEHGLNTHFGEQVFINQGCTFMDGGGIWIGDRVMIGPKVNLITCGHPTDPAERRDGIVEAPIVVEHDVWIGAAATVLPGVRVGHDAVIGAGAVVAKDVAPGTLVTGPAAVERERWDVGG